MPEQNQEFMATSTLLALKGGAVMQDLSNRLREVIQAVRTTEKKGVVNLKLTVAPAVKGSGEIVVIEATMRCTKPEPELGKTIFYTTEEGNLLQNDPNQLKMFEERR
jgi:hypothetical protein